MAHRFVQQNPGPTRTQYHRQGTGRCRNGFQVNQRLAQRLAGVAHGAVIGKEIPVVGTPAAAMATALAATILLDDHTDIKPYQRPYIRRQPTIGGRHQNAFPHTGHAHGHLLYARVEGTGGGVDTLE